MLILIGVPKSANVADFAVRQRERPLAIARALMSAEAGQTRLKGKEPNPDSA